MVDVVEKASNINNFHRLIFKLSLIDNITSFPDMFNVLLNLKKVSYHDVHKLPE